MTRSRASARTQGTRFETTITRYLAIQLGDDRIERRARNGAKDRGDIGGLRTLAGGRVVAECKDVAALSLSSWMTEAEIERGNDDAQVAVVVHKRARRSNPGDQWVTMTLDDLIALLSGHRPEAP